MKPDGLAGEAASAFAGRAGVAACLSSTGSAGWAGFRRSSGLPGTGGVAARARWPRLRLRFGAAGASASFAAACWAGASAGGSGGLRVAAAFVVTLVGLVGRGAVFRPVAARRAAGFFVAVAACSAPRDLAAFRGVALRGDAACFRGAPDVRLVRAVLVLVAPRAGFALLGREGFAPAALFFGAATVRDGAFFFAGERTVFVLPAFAPPFGVRAAADFAGRLLALPAFLTAVLPDCGFLAVVFFDDDLVAELFFAVNLLAATFFALVFFAAVFRAAGLVDVPFPVAFFVAFFFFAAAPDEATRLPRPCGVPLEFRADLAPVFRAAMFASQAARDVRWSRSAESATTPGTGHDTARCGSCAIRLQVRFVALLSRVASIRRPARPGSPGGPAIIAARARGLPIKRPGSVAGPVAGGLRLVAEIQATSAPSKLSAVCSLPWGITGAQNLSPAMRSCFNSTSVSSGWRSAM